MNNKACGQLLCPSNFSFKTDDQNFIIDFITEQEIYDISENMITSKQRIILTAEIFDLDFHLTPVTKFKTLIEERFIKNIEGNKKIIYIEYNILEIERREFIRVRDNNSTYTIDLIVYNPRIIKQEEIKE